MNAREKEALKRGILLASAVLILLYIAYQVYLVTHSTVSTQLAYSTTVNDSVATEVFAVRNETTIKSSGKGTLISVIEDGSRVAKGEAVAVVFSNQSAASNYSELSRISEDLSRYRRLNSQQSSYAVDVSAMNDKVSGDVIRIAEIVDSGNLAGLQDSIYDARDDAITTQIATGEEVDLSSKIAQLTEQYQSYKAAGTTHSSLNSRTSGYYSSTIDGYETTVDYGSVRELTAEQIKKILDSEPKAKSPRIIGKVFADFDWYMLCIVPTNRAGDLAVGDTVKVNFPYSAVSSLPAKVYSVGNEKSSDDTAIVLKCNRMDSGIATLRKESAQLVIHSYDGIRVNSDAILVNAKGDKGVFVKEGNLCRFRKLDVIYNGEDFVLSKPHEEAGYVSVYDNVILGGKGLYDGKVIS